MTSRLAPRAGLVLLWAVASFCPGALVYVVDASRAQPAPDALAATGTRRAVSSSSNIDFGTDVDLPEWREVEDLERGRRRAAVVSVVLVDAPIAVLLVVALFFASPGATSVVVASLHVFAVVCACGSLVADLVRAVVAARMLAVLAQSRQIASELELLPEFAAAADVRLQLLADSSVNRPASVSAREP